ncbi:choline kinase [Methylomonas lenta]|uniref:Choline kinase n=1 Tax=Methylomonas lenta TaxID=980561 RepID=A0A177NN88_9GAMM|nr:phosphotransferase [Methylomonas lenta]OAI19415.1 choline kinase [Methylomonas lenta]
MNSHIRELILTSTGAQTAFHIEIVQRLWSGYGDIVRYGLTGGDRSTVIVKHVKLRSSGRGVSHQRKVRSYQVETAWYSQWSGRCDAYCRVPACLAFESFGDEVFIVLEDLDTAGFPKRRSFVGDDEMHACLKWLANFHATFIGEHPKGLWSTGTYWHLATRPDELQALNDPVLKNAASLIDQKLRNSSYQTFVHGDAKLANFCFSDDGKHVAAVDFQYVGGGCGIKDVAYFIDSCLDGDQAERQLNQLLDVYFLALKQALKTKQKAVDADDVERDWRALYPVAWTDFHRFLKGWGPGYWPTNSYSERLARQVIAQL